MRSAESSAVQMDCGSLIPFQKDGSLYRMVVPAGQKQRVVFTTCGTTTAATDTVIHAFQDSVE
jgi:hypothetical protein